MEPFRTTWTKVPRQQPMFVGKSALIAQSRKATRLIFLDNTGKRQRLRGYLLGVGRRGTFVPLNSCTPLELCETEIEADTGISTSCGYSWASTWPLKNTRVLWCSRTNSRIRSPRRKVFGSMDECKQGKSTSSIRNFGKRIGFVDLVRNVCLSEECDSHELLLRWAQQPH